MIFHFIPILSRSTATMKPFIEIPLLLIFYAFLVSDSVTTNLIIYRTCYITLGYNQSECALLGSKHPDNQTAHLEKIVEPHATIITMTHSITTACVSAITCLFIGPWSDRFGRKPVLVIPVVGFIVGYILMAVFAALENLSPWYFMACAVPVLLTGGGSPYLTVLLCYITDMTNESNRGLKMGVFEAVLSLGIFLGNVSSSYIFGATGYSAVFLISAFCCFLNLIYTVFLIPESLQNREIEGRLKGLFQFDNMIEMLKTTFKKRENYERLIVLCCVLMLTLFIVQINGDGSVIFYFLREKFHWSLEKYTLYSSAHNVAWILGTVIGVYFLHKLLKVPESVMILIGFLSMFNGNVGMGLAAKDWMVYAAAVSRSLGAVLSPMVRSLVSKIVPNEEVGKIFALIVASESLFGIAGAPIYTAIYNMTLTTNPAIFNFVSAGIYLIEILIAILIIVVRTARRSEDSYNRLINEDREEQSPREEAVA